MSSSSACYTSPRVAGTAHRDFAFYCRPILGVKGCFGVRRQPAVAILAVCFPRPKLNPNPCHSTKNEVLAFLAGCLVWGLGSKIFKRKYLKVCSRGRGTCATATPATAAIGTLAPRASLRTAQPCGCTQTCQCRLCDREVVIVAKWAPRASTFPLGSQD